MVPEPGPGGPGPVISNSMSIMKLCSMHIFCTQSFRHERPLACTNIFSLNRYMFIQHGHNHSFKSTKVPSLITRPKFKELVLLNLGLLIRWTCFKSRS